MVSMSLIRLIPVIVSLFLLSAHFYRAGIMALAIALPACLLLLFVRNRYAARFLQILLVLGAIEWVRTVIVLVLERQSMGRPWIRLAFILGTVAILTFSSALVFRSKSLRKRYLSGPRPKQKG